MWARVQRKLAADPAALPAEVVALVAAPCGLSPDALAGSHRRPATRTAHVRKVCRELGVRAFGEVDDPALGAFMGEKVHPRNQEGARIV